MPAAYDPQGRLKKHALKGTSLAVDPSRVAQREQFETLHEEAKSAAGEGRGAMLGRLQKRYQAFEEPQTRRLQTIAERKRGFEEEYAGLRDQEEEMRFAEHEKYAEGKGSQRKRFEQLAGAGIPQEFLREAEEQYYRENPNEKRIRGGSFFPQESGRRTGKAKRLAKKGTSMAAKSFGFGGPGQKVIKKATKPFKKLFGGKTRKQREGSRQRRLSAYTKQLWEERYGDPAEQAYRERISAEVDRINKQYIPLQEEEMERQERLADRADLYNMFLGG